MKGIKGEREKWVIDLSIVDGRLCFYLRSSNHLKILTRPEKQNNLNPRRLTVLLRRRASKETDLDRCLPSTAWTEKMERIMGISTKCKKESSSASHWMSTIFHSFPYFFCLFLRTTTKTTHNTTRRNDASRKDPWWAENEDEDDEWHKSPKRILFV